MYWWCLLIVAMCKRVGLKIWRYVVVIYLLGTDLKPLACFKAGQPGYKPAGPF